MVRVNEVLKGEEKERTQKIRNIKCKPIKVNVYFICRLLFYLDIKYV